MTLVEDLPKRKRRTLSPKNTKISSAPKRKLKAPQLPQSISKPHKILQMLKSKAIKSPYKEIDEPNVKTEVDPPEAFSLEKDNISDAETIVGEIESGDLCKEMNECLAKFATFALSSPDNGETDVKYPESVSPPLQEMSPTTSEPPAFTQKSQRIIAVNKIFNKDDKSIDFQSQITDLNVPLNARGPKEEKTEAEDKDTDVYRYITFGLKIKKAMEECQDMINSYGKDDKPDVEEPPSLEQIVEVMMSLDKNSAEFLENMVTDDPIDMNVAITKLTELVENMPQTLANMPEVASKLSEFANASFELFPEFASIMNSLPDVNNEAQLTQETLKQIRELNLSKRDNIKVTKHTAKRKITRRARSNEDSAVFEFEGKDLSELLKDEKEMQNIMKSKNKTEFKDFLFTSSAQVVINKVFEYLKQNKSPELSKFLEEVNELFYLQRTSWNSEMHSKAKLFEKSVKDTLSMDELRELVKTRCNSWKHNVAAKLKSIPIDILECEIEATLEKFYAHIQYLSQNNSETDKILEKIDELTKREEDYEVDRDTFKQITMALGVYPENALDMFIMKLPAMPDRTKKGAKVFKFRYIDVTKRCAESPQLVSWILQDPESAINAIQELTGLEVRKIDNAPDFSSLSNDRKREYFMAKIKEMNRQYMQSLPKSGLTCDEWLILLHRLELLEDTVRDALINLAPQTKAVQTQSASEAEIVAGKGLSKIIGKANVKVVKKIPDMKAIKREIESEPEKDDKKAKNDALLAKCEAILTSKGEKSLLDSFYTIKSYITQGLPVPETYKKHVISICSSIDAKLLDEDIEETLKLKSEELEDQTDNKSPLSVIGSQNPELLAKYSAQALRNAKQTLNAVAFRNMTRNGQTKSESDVCDTPKTNCKFTNDCICDSCNVDVTEDRKEDVKKEKEVKKIAPSVKQSKQKCENVSHQQHVCKG